MEAQPRSFEEHILDTQQAWVEDNRRAKHIVPTTAEQVEMDKLQRHDHGIFDVPKADPREVAWRHQHWHHKRAKIMGAIAKTDSTGKRLARMENCGCFGTIEYSKSRNKHRATCWHCHDRFCEPCMKPQRRDLLQIVRNNVKGARTRFLCLTVVHKDEPLRDSMARLAKGFTNLKRSKLWKTKVSGGVAVMECKVGNDGLWHPHYHLITTGDYIDLQDLIKAWHKATGNSTNVKIELCENTEAALMYVTKYITKPITDEMLADEDHLVEFICACAVPGNGMSSAHGAVTR